MLVACGEKDEPEPTPEPAPIDVSETAIADAPPGIQGVEYGKYCGEEVVDIRGRVKELQSLECIEDSLANEAPAWGTVVVPTVEGDPIPITYAAQSESDVLVFVDGTEDKFGSRAWNAHGCLEMPSKTVFPNRCGRPIEVDDRTPTEFLERAPLKSCGRLGINLAILERGDVRFHSRAFNCFDRAVRRGESAELFARSTSEEGPVEYYLRATEDATIERYSDATRGGTGPRAWYYEECDRVSTYLNLHGCSDRTELPAP